MSDSELSDDGIFDGVYHTRRGSRNITLTETKS